MIGSHGKWWIYNWIFNGIWPTIYGDMLDIWWDMIDGISPVLTLFNEDLGFFNGDVMGEPTIWRNVMGYDITSQLEIHGSVGKWWFISGWNGVEHSQHLGLSENLVPLNPRVNHHFPMKKWTFWVHPACTDMGALASVTLVTATWSLQSSCHGAAGELRRSSPTIRFS
jgi:hypothetical protein